MLKIKQAALAASAVKKEQYPPTGLAQVVLIGRSNAGKSSLINTLVNRKSLARTSSAPGKTRLLNFYRVDGSLDDLPFSCYLVDLPGYGYAKVSRSERMAWLKMIDGLLQSEAPRRCWQLVDIRHQPSVQDIAMHETLRQNGMQPLVIANKADKISRGARAAAVQQIAAALQIPRQQIVVFSAVSREGRDILLQQMAEFLQQQAKEALQQTLPQAANAENPD